MAKARTKIKFGLQQHRFKDNPEEARFARAWHRQQAGKTLAYLLGNGKDPSEMVSARDNDVAATVIQWLGSPVGQAFLEDLGYIRPRSVRTIVDPQVKEKQKRLKRIDKAKDKVFRVRQILSQLDIDLLNIDHADR